MSRLPHLRSRDEDGHDGQVTLPGAPTLRPREEVGKPPKARRRRIKPLPVIGGLLVLVALLGYLAVYAATTHRTAVLITTRALPPGATLSAGDLRTGDLSGDSAVISGLVPDGQLQQVLGQRLSSGLPAGTPLARSALSAQGSQASQITLAVPALHALGGSLQAGDSVTVLATFGAGTGNARTKPIARGLEVLAVGSVPAGEDPSTATVPVTLALPNPSVSSALALAEEDGKLDLLRQGGSGQSAPIPPVSDQGGGP
jgi:Flp pilus assembly protein CpaB